MKRILLIWLVAALSIATLPCMAHHQGVGVTLSEPIKIGDTQLSQEQRKELFEKIEEAIDAGDPTLKGWRQILNWPQMFNMYRRTINRVRIQNASGNDLKALNEIVNVTMVQTFTHGIETLSGPVLFSIGQANNWPQSINTGVLIIGAIISMPTGGVLDPLCAVGLYFYSSNTGFKVVDTIRAVIFWPFGFTARKTGISTFLKWALQEKDVQTDLLNRMSHPKSRNIILPINVEEPMQFLLRTESGREIAQLNFKLGNKRLWLESAEFKLPLEPDPSILTKDFWQKPLGTESRRQLKKALKPFGWNVKDAVLRAFNMIQREQYGRLASEAHVSNTHTTDEGLLVEFMENTVQLKPGYQLDVGHALRNTKQSCAQWLGASG